MQQIMEGSARKLRGDKPTPYASWAA